MAKALPVILLFLSLCSCSAWGSRDAFYRGLRLKTESAAQEQSEKTKLLDEARAFFEKALNSRNVYIRRAASTEILDLLYDGHAVSRQVLRRIQREPPGGSWAAAFDVLETLPEGRRRKSPSEADLARVREKALAFLLDAENFTGENAAPGFTGAFPDTAAFYVLRECLAFDPGIFSPAESATIDGHFAALRSRFGEALARFRVTLETPPRPGNSDNPAAFAELPAGADLFFRYPGLLNSLGRAFQYGSSDGEGIDLFLEWERIAGRENITQNTGEIRFKLLFFAGRIARQRGRLREGVSLFERALPFAPDSTQSDACIWYILDSALSLGSDIMLEKLPLLITQWHDKAYFYDVLDKLTAVLAASRRWNDIASVFPFIRDYADNASVANTPTLPDARWKTAFFLLKNPAKQPPIRFARLWKRPTIQAAARIITGQKARRLWGNLLSYCRLSRRAARPKDKERGIRRRWYSCGDFSLIKWPSLLPGTSELWTGSLIPAKSKFWRKLWARRDCTRNRYALFLLFWNMTAASPAARI